MIRPNRITGRGNTTTTSTTREEREQHMTTTENVVAPEVIEGEIVGTTDGPQADTAAPAGEDNSSGNEVSTTEDAPVAEVSDLTQKQARTLTDKIKKGLTGAADTHDKLNQQVGNAAELMSEAYSKRIWLALEEESWEEFVNKELGEVRVRLERSVRQSLVYQLNAGPAHMSTRAIAPVLGVDQKTVSNDLRQVRRELGVTTTPVVGQDGKEYSEAVSVPRQRKPKPIEDRFGAAIEKADAAVGDLVALSVEDGWDDAVGAVAKTHRKDIARLIDSLKGVQDRLTSQ